MKFTQKHAIISFISLLCCVVVFHFCILLKIIPYNITWGGRLQNDADMYRFETFSIILNIFMIYTVAMKGGYTRRIVSEKVIRNILWIFFLLFVLNTVGNLFAQTTFEKSMAVLTLISALLLAIILKKPR